MKTLKEHTAKVMMHDAIEQSRVALELMQRIDKSSLCDDLLAEDTSALIVTLIQQLKEQSDFLLDQIAES